MPCSPHRIRQTMFCTLLGLCAAVAVAIGYLAAGPHGLTPEQREVLASLRSGQVKRLSDLPHRPAAFQNVSEVRDPRPGAETYLYYPMPDSRRKLVIIVDEEFHVVDRYLADGE